MTRAGLALLAFAWASSAAAAAPAQVPFVGCPSDGQLGPQPAPRRGAVPRVPSAAAAQLAYYASAGLGVFAPRGWHCFGLYGSNGAILIVTPESHGARDLLDSPSPLRGPAVQITYSEGATSGRLEVASVIARAFPAHMSFARSVSEDLGQALPAGPYRTDRMVRLRPNVVGYTTPAGREGLGTDSRLAPNDRPVDGLVILDPEGDMNLIKLDVRLPAAQAGLATPILNAAFPPRRARR